MVLKNQNYQQLRDGRYYDITYFVNVYLDHILYKMVIVTCQKKNTP